MSSGVANTVNYRSGEREAVTEITAGEVSDRIDRDRTGTQLRTQRVDKRLTNSSDTRGFGCAAREHHLDVGARLSG